MPKSELVGISDRLLSFGLKQLILNQTFEIRTFGSTSLDRLYKKIFFFYYIKQPMLAGLVWISNRNLATFCLGMEQVFVMILALFGFQTCGFRHSTVQLTSKNPTFRFRTRLVWFSFQTEHSVIGQFH